VGEVLKPAMGPLLPPPPSPSQGGSWAQERCLSPEKPAAAPPAPGELIEEEKKRRRAEKFGLPLEDTTSARAADRRGVWAIPESRV